MCGMAILYVQKDLKWLWQPLGDRQCDFHTVSWVELKKRNHYWITREISEHVIWACNVRRRCIISSWRFLACRWVMVSWKATLSVWDCCVFVNSWLCASKLTLLLGVLSRPDPFVFWPLAVKCNGDCVSNHETVQCSSGDKVYWDLLFICPCNQVKGAFCNLLFCAVCVAWTYHIMFQVLCHFYQTHYHGTGIVPKRWTCFVTPAAP